MLSRFNITNKPFYKNVATLATGAVVSQLIVVLASPVLTRIYGVADFGLLSLFSSATVFMAVITTGRYEFAIVLPENDEKAKDVLRLIYITGLAVSFFYLLLVLAGSLLNLRGDLSILYESGAVYLIPVYTFLIASYTGLGYWFQRIKGYKTVSVATTIQSLSGMVIGVVLGLLGCTPLGMILGTISGTLISALYLKSRWLKSHQLKFNIPNIKAVAKEYVSFPRYMILSDLSVAATQQLTPIVFVSFYNTMVVGYYALANRIVRLPVIVIVGALANVFRNEAIEEIRLKGNCAVVYKSLFRKLLFIGIPVFVLVYILSPVVFSWVFGDEWSISGTYARLLALMLLTEFVAYPLNSVFYLLSKQKLYMRLQFVTASAGLAFIYLGYHYFNDAYYSILFYSLSNAILNIFFVIITFRLANQKR